MRMNVYVVTISETAAVHANEVDVETFANHEDAVSWIEEQITEKIGVYQLDESDVDGWYVEVDGPSHTIQYNLKECVLR